MDEINVTKVYEAYKAGEPITQREFEAMSDKLGDKDSEANRLLESQANVLPEIPDPEWFR